MKHLRNVNKVGNNCSHDSSSWTCSHMNRFEDTNSFLHPLIPTPLYWLCSLHPHNNPHSPPPQTIPHPHPLKTTLLPHLLTHTLLPCLLEPTLLPHLPKLTLLPHLLKPTLPPHLLKPSLPTSSNPPSFPTSLDPPHLLEPSLFPTSLNTPPFPTSVKTPFFPTPLYPLSSPPLPCPSYLALSDPLILAGSLLATIITIYSLPSLFAQKVGLSQLSWASAFRGGLAWLVLFWSSNA